ncbi:phage tail protein [Schaalia hyovaginalis]|uniref:Microcystin-dependent protein n=1 Tax=Schaalia hyovaginalis TaxID=29316 RepID=A0A923E4R8_9ACTO|nr:tail fiber protein [Schaalia hyovaginalis]MBB6333631.1 microcystin-dependent protein [Schaalia hyovaginalis]MDY2669763.1 tail fiber protein [Schaalia hyovaginalis]
MSTLDYLMDTLAQVKARAESAASYRWATVTSVRPLRLLFDGEQTPVLREPVNLVGPLEAGQRVWVITVLRRSTIVGRAGGSGLPTGALLPYAGATPPQGFLLCDGATHPKTQYPALAAVLGATGTGTSFNVPDMRGRFPLGAGRNRANTSSYWGTAAAGQVNIPLGEYAGEYEHTLTVDQMPNHNHGVYSTSSKWVNGAGIYASNVGAGSGWEIVSNWAANANFLDTRKVGGDKAFKSMPPYYSVNFIIKT